MIDSQAERGKGFSLFGGTDKRASVAGVGGAGLRKTLDSYRKRKKIGEVLLESQFITSFGSPPCRLEKSGSRGGRKIERARSHCGNANDKIIITVIASPKGVAISFLHRIASLRSQ
jgi:hypothetical protein